MNTKQLEVGRADVLTISCQHPKIEVYAFNLYIIMPATIPEMLLVEGVNPAISEAEFAWQYNRDKGLLLVSVLGKPGMPISVNGRLDLATIDVMPLKAGTVQLNFATNTNIIISEAGDIFPQDQIQFVGVENSIANAINPSASLILEIK